MNLDRRALIVQLCSYAGGMMEDASVRAVTAAEVEDSKLSAVIEDLVKQVCQISAMLAAAAALAKNVASA